MFVHFSFRHDDTSHDERVEADTGKKLCHKVYHSENDEKLNDVFWEKPRQSTEECKGEYEELKDSHFGFVELELVGEGNYEESVESKEQRTQHHVISGQGEAENDIEIRSVENQVHAVHKMIGEYMHVKYCQRFYVNCYVGFEIPINT